MYRYYLEHVTEDGNFISAKQITKEKARQLWEDAHRKDDTFFICDILIHGVPLNVFDFYINDTTRVSTYNE